ncbi:MAG: hypothetical protein BWY31_00242 [Lentisphaerae bacterium ADurb.Bin242]|nr:MAG: hypothetical protein BWY31_00242 [Lentisphaerae bacterium ADurb.Bin242]
MTTHYTYSESGASIFGSYERFNRVLYGGHGNDGKQERFFTFAGDTPIFMGASSDYTKDTWCYQAKNGVLMSGLALTPGHAEMGSHDLFSGWFHECSDILAVWRHGYMSYEFTRFSPWFPDVRVEMQIYPLNPDDGFLVHYGITTDQRVIFCAGFGGITPFFGRFEYHTSARRDFSAEDCENTQAEAFGNCASVRGPNEVAMWIGTDFSCEYSTDSAEAMTEKYPSLFLTEHEKARQIVKLRRILAPGETLSGNLAVVRNGSPEILQKYLTMDDPCQFLRGKIREKFAGVSFHTPDTVLDSSVPDTLIALDASFHGRSFYHGAIGYHAPFLGWRGWYAPTLLGWTERVRKAIESHFATITRSPGKERVWWDGADRPDLDHEGTQYHHLENSSGHLTALLHRDDIYDMQEVAVDMTLFHLDHTADLETGKLIFDRLCEILDWEERILDPDGDGLYQNFLNTWISDGHSYNGGACAQASAYNYYANLRAARLGRQIGKDVEKLEKRAQKIRAAFQEKLWLEEKGVLAESIDTLGNKQVHPSPELSTIYLAADCETVDSLQTFRMLRWAERNIKSVLTANRKGRLYFSSNWLPKKYSTCGIFPAENACLALAYFRNGQREKAMEIVNGLADAFALSPYPGSITHVLSAQGGTDNGDIDFTDVSSCYLRMLIEGLWGVRFELSEDRIHLTPQLPDDWPQADLTLPEIALHLKRSELSDTLSVFTQSEAEKIIRLPMRHAGIDQVFLNGKETGYSVVPGIRTCFLEVQTRETGKIELQVFYRKSVLPVLKQNILPVFPGNIAEIEVVNGTLTDLTGGCGLFEILHETRQRKTVKIMAENPGLYDCFVHAEQEDAKGILPLTFEVKTLAGPERIFSFSKQETVDLSSCFNASLTEIHQQEFRSPRPEGYSIGMRLNGRYAWEWNHYGHNALKVDDSGLRNSGGIITSSSGVQFKTPETGRNALCVSLWDNFPTAAEIPLSGKAEGLAVLFCGTTNAMQSHVVNARFSVLYTDGTSETVELVHPENFDDFLVPALQKENESLYFSEGTHGTVQKIRLNPARELKTFRAEAVANEVIVSILSLTLFRQEHC